MDIKEQVFQIAKNAKHAASAVANLSSVEKDEALLNYISIIPVNPKKFPRVNHADTMTFVKWLTDPAKGQKIIADFGKDKYGAPLFFANSREWQAAQKKPK